MVAQIVIRGQLDFNYDDCDSLLLGLVNTIIISINNHKLSILRFEI